MRVLFVSPALFGPEGVYGGGERYAYRLARAVAVEVEGATLLSAAERELDRRDGPLRVIARPPWTWVRGQKHNPLPRGLLHEIRSADLVHCFQHHTVQTSLSLMVGAVLRRPVVVTDLGGGGWDISAWIDTAGWADRFLHLSRYAQSVARRTGRLEDGVLYGGADAGLPQYSAGGEVLFVGRLLPHKGVDVLLEAAESYWRVRIVGTPMHERYLAVLRNLAAGKRVEFVFHADDEELERAYAAAAVVVVPSVPRDRYGGTTAVAELLGLVAIEAAARGIPVVASNTASLPEIVLDGVTGYLFPPGDVVALRERVGALLANPELRRRFGEAGAQSVTERFSWSRAAATAIQHYREALTR